VAVLANNHALDYGNAALDRTRELLDQAGVRHVGAGPDGSSAYTPIFVDAGDWRVGIAAFSRVPCSWSASGENTRPGVGWACDPFRDSMFAAVDAIVADADVSVVMLHGGTEAVRCPDDSMRQLYADLAERQVDLVVSGHPHRLQGIERIGDAWVVRSMGNFTFPSARGEGADSAIFLFDVTDDGIGLRVVPVRVPGGVANLASSDTAERILDDISGFSPGWSFDEQGRAIEAGDPGVCDR
jgi:poly-gamma-glutamate synthesis protein (capsule biosynthesis protein)